MTTATANAQEARKRFSVILNEKFENDNYIRGAAAPSLNTSCQTDPIREQLCRFRNGEGGHRFTVEDWLRW